MSEKGKFYIGVDVGSVSADIAALDENENIIESKYVRHGGRPIQVAGQALRELYRLPAFALPASRLAVASGGAPPQMFDKENLLLEDRVTIDAQGRMQEVRHLVWRVTSDDPNQTVTDTWSPWREDKPEIRARVVSPAGRQIEVDPATFIETTLAEDTTSVEKLERILLRLADRVAARLRSLPTVAFCIDPTTVNAFGKATPHTVGRHVHPRAESHVADEAAPKPKLPPLVTPK